MSTPVKPLLFAAIAAGVLVVSGTLLDRAWHSRLTAEAAKTEAAIEEANQLRVVAQEAIDSANAARARADTAEHRAETYHAQFLAARARKAPIVAAAPAVCDSALAAVQAEADAAAQEAASATAALAAQKEAFARLQAASGAQGKALDVLVPASEGLVKASHRSFLAGLLPKAGFGVTAGIDVHGQPNATAGITIHW